ncbi:MAG: hypothetical protein ACLFUH_07940 [Bacteroidales bacterium]
MKKILILTLLTVLGIKANIAQDFEVAPISLHFTANPGESQTKTLTVKNHSNKETSIVLTLRDYLVDKEGNKKLMPAESAKNSLAKWVTANPAYINMNPNESQTVQLTLQAPNDEYSSKWGVLSVATAKEQTSFSADKELTAGIGIYGRIDVDLAYTPESEMDGNQRVKISNLKEVTNQEDSVRKFSAHIDNLGDILANCEVYLIASNMETLDETKFSKEKFVAYPQNSRTIELTLPEDKLPKGKYSLSAILDYGSNESLEGTQTTIEVE